MLRKSGLTKSKTKIVEKAYTNTHKLPPSEKNGYTLVHLEAERMEILQMPTCKECGLIISISEHGYLFKKNT